MSVEIAKPSEVVKKKLDPNKNPDAEALNKVDKGPPYSSESEKLQIAKAKPEAAKPEVAKPEGELAIANAQGKPSSSSEKSNSSNIASSSDSSEKPESFMGKLNGMFAMAKSFLPVTITAPFSAALAWVNGLPRVKNVINKYVEIVEKGESVFDLENIMALASAFMKVPKKPEKPEEPEAPTAPTAPTAPKQKKDADEYTAYGPRKEGDILSRGLAYIRFRESSNGKNVWKANDNGKTSFGVWQLQGKNFRDFLTFLRKKNKKKIASELESFYGNNFLKKSPKISGKAVSISNKIIAEQDEFMKTVIMPRELSAMMKWVKPSINSSLSDKSKILMINISHQFSSINKKKIIEEASKSSKNQDEFQKNLIKYGVEYASSKTKGIVKERMNYLYGLQDVTEMKGVQRYVEVMKLSHSSALKKLKNWSLSSSSGVTNGSKASDATSLEGIKESTIFGMNVFYDFLVENNFIQNGENVVCTGGTEDGHSVSSKLNGCTHSGGDKFDVGYGSNGFSRKEMLKYFHDHGIRGKKKSGYNRNLVYIFTYKGVTFQYHDETTHGDIAVLSVNNNSYKKSKLPNSSKKNIEKKEKILQYTIVKCTTAQAIKYERSGKVFDSSGRRIMYCITDTAPFSLRKSKIHHSKKYGAAHGTGFDELEHGKANDFKVSQSSINQGARKTDYAYLVTKKGLLINFFPDNLGYGAMGETLVLKKAKMDPNFNYNTIAVEFALRADNSNGDGVEPLNNAQKAAGKYFFAMIRAKHNIPKNHLFTSRDPVRGIPESHIDDFSDSDRIALGIPTKSEAHDFINSIRVA